MRDEYFIQNQSLKVISADGLGPIDFAKSDFFEPEQNNPHKGTSMAIQRIDSSIAKPKIYFRKGTEFCDVIYIRVSKFLLISFKMYDKIKHQLAPALTSITECTVFQHDKHQFGEVYIYGELLETNMINKKINFKNSVFDITSRSEHCILQTKIERGKKPRDSKYSAIETGCCFECYEEYISKQKKHLLNTIVPVEIELKINELPAVINISPEITLFRKDIANTIRSSKLPGTMLFGPSVIVSTRGASI